MDLNWERDFIRDAFIEFSKTSSIVQRGIAQLWRAIYDISKAWAVDHVERTRSIGLFVGLLRSHAGDERTAMNALRGCGVAFLAFVAVSTGEKGELLSPTVAVTVLGLLGTLMSVVGNDASIRFGRRRLIAAAMLLSIAVGHRIPGLDRLLTRRSAGDCLRLDHLARFVVADWGRRGSADPSRRGATLTVHSTLGYAGGFIGPLAIGWSSISPAACRPLGGASPSLSSPRSWSWCWSFFSRFVRENCRGIGAANRTR